VPGPTPIVAAALERVGVEIVLAFVRKPGQRAVVERALHHIGVGAIEIYMQHAMRPKGERDRGAGLRIGRFVGEIVVLSKTFVGGLRSRRCRPARSSARVPPSTSP
jgi:hypothetical protein